MMKIIVNMLIVLPLYALAILLVIVCHWLSGEHFSADSEVGFGFGENDRINDK